MTLMAGEKITARTDWILFPETAVDDPFNETMTEGNRYVALLDSFLAINRHSSLLTGFTTISSFTGKPGKRDNAAIISDSGDEWYEIYKSAAALSYNNRPGFYHKSKLVPGMKGRYRVCPRRLTGLSLTSAGQ
ncbi:MAG: hypothetical protein R2744_06225 [Bacteroidales bacterium]